MTFVRVLGNIWTTFERDFPSILQLLIVWALIWNFDSTFGKFIGKYGFKDVVSAFQLGNHPSGPLKVFLDPFIRPVLRWGPNQIPDVVDLVSQFTQLGFVLLFGSILSHISASWISSHNFCHPTVEFFLLEAFWCPLFFLYPSPCLASKAENKYAFQIFAFHYQSNRDIYTTLISIIMLHKCVCVHLGPVWKIW